VALGLATAAGGSPGWRAPVQIGATKACCVDRGGPTSFGGSRSRAKSNRRRGLVLAAVKEAAPKACVKPPSRSGPGRHRGGRASRSRVPSTSNHRRRTVESGSRFRSGGGSGEEGLDRWERRGLERTRPRQVPHLNVHAWFWVMFCLW
jgi:hypothetical protein